eukprot:SAG11_NODE_1620_length_4569_cov_2.059955_6_plen_39_part_00
MEHRFVNLQRYQEAASNDRQQLQMKNPYFEHLTSACIS